MKPTLSHFLERPATRLGWWAIGLAVASFVLGFAWLFLPAGALISFLCGLAGGIIALIAIIREHERSWLVWLSILPMINVFVFIIAEFLFPH
jgi:hypothetical protein